MKLLINASTLSGTGVTQVAISFIQECKQITEHTYHILISRLVESQLDLENYPLNFIFYPIDTPPQFLLKGYTTRKKLRKIEKELRPDCVFSVFGPSYWTPCAPHLMGYAYGHYVYPDSPYFKSLALKYIIKISIYKFLHRFFLKRNGNYYVCETEDVSKRLLNYLNVPAEHIYTVPNTYNHFFSSFHPSNNRLLPARARKEFRLLSLCSFAPHKNLEILNKVIPRLRQRISHFDIRFILTVDNDLLKARISSDAQTSIVNLERIDISQCPQLYYECDALFLPTLLECSTANYPEAMIMERPILTSNLSFATTVCKNAAMYFDPLNPDEIADRIIELIESQALRQQLVDNGKEQLQFFSTSNNRARSYLAIFEKIKRNVD